MVIGTRSDLAPCFHGLGTVTSLSTLEEIVLSFKFLPARSLHKSVRLHRHCTSPWANDSSVYLGSATTCYLWNVSACGLRASMLRIRISVQTSPTWCPLCRWSAIGACVKVTFCKTISTKLRVTTNLIIGWIRILRRCQPNCECLNM
jgi:hypothetical protein